VGIHRSFYTRRRRNSYLVSIEDQVINSLEISDMLRASAHFYNRDTKLTLSVAYPPEKFKTTKESISSRDSATLARLTLPTLNSYNHILNFLGCEVLACSQAGPLYFAKDPMHGLAHLHTCGKLFAVMQFG